MGGWVKIPDSRVIAHSALQPKWHVRFTHVFEFVKTMLMARPRFTNKQGYLHAQRTQDNPRFKFTSHAITDAWFKSEMRFQMLLSNKLQKHIVQMLLHNRCPMALVRGGKRQQWVGAPWPSNAATVLLRLQYKAASTYGGVTPYPLSQSTPTINNLQTTLTHLAP